MGIGENVGENVGENTGQGGRIIVPTSANLLFSDGFESGDFSEWDETGSGQTVETTNPRTGTYSLEYVAGSDYVAKAFTNRKRIYVSHYRYFDTGFPFAHGPGNHLWRLQSDGGQGQMDWEYGSTTAHIYVFSNGASDETDHVITHNFTSGQWYHIETDFQWNDVGQSNGHLKIWIDGAQKINATSQEYSTTTEEYTDNLLITSNCETNCSGAKYWVDDVTVYDVDPVRG